MADYEEIAAFPYYSWHHAILVPRGHPLTELPTRLRWKISVRGHWLPYQSGLTGRTKIDAAFAMADIEPDIVLSAQDSDVIKTRSWV